MNKGDKFLSEIKVWKIISCVCFFFLLASLIMVCNLRSYNKKVQKVLEHSIAENSGILQSLEIVNKNNKEFQVQINNDTKKSITDSQIIEYKSFMEKYYETQSNWLNTWLTFLAIVLGLMAIVAPILFVRFNEKQEEKLSNTISNAEEKTKEMEKLKKEINLNIETHKEDMENQLKDVKKDLAEVKTFKNQSKISELLSTVNLKMQRKEYKEALNLYNEVLNLDPDNFIAISDRGVCYGYLKNYEKSIDDFNKALEIKHNDVHNLTNRGMSYNKLGKYNLAINDFSNSLKQNPNNTFALNGKGFAEIKLGKYEDAITDYKKAIELEPKNQMIFYNLIEAYLFADQLVKASETMKIYLEFPKCYIIDDDLQIWKELTEKAVGNKQDKEDLIQKIDSLEIKTRKSLEDE